MLNFGRPHNFVERLFANSRYPSFSIGALISYPRSTTTNITIFEQIATDLRNVNATSTWHFVNQNEGQNKDPNLKAVYKYQIEIKLLGEMISSIAEFSSWDDCGFMLNI